MIWSPVTVLEDSGIQHSLWDWAARVETTATVPGAKQGHSIGKSHLMDPPSLPLALEVKAASDLWPSRIPLCFLRIAKQH